MSTTISKIITYEHGKTVTLEDLGFERVGTLGSVSINALTHPLTVFARKVGKTTVYLTHRYGLGYHLTSDKFDTFPANCGSFAEVEAAIDAI